MALQTPPLASHPSYASAVVLDVVAASLNVSSPITGIDMEARNILNDVIAGINSISLSAAMGAIITYCLIWIMNRKSANRISLRLSMYICLADFIFHKVNLLGVGILDHHPPWMCKAYTFGYVMFNLLSIFFTVCIAIHLQITFVNAKAFATFHSQYGGPLIERAYVFSAFFSAMAIASIPLFFDMYGWNIPERTCWYLQPGSTRNLIYQWTTLYTWMIGGSLYSAYTVLRVVLRIRTIEKSLKQQARVNSDGDIEVRRPKDNENATGMNEFSNGDAIQEKGLDTNGHGTHMGSEHSLTGKPSANDVARSTLMVQLAITKRLIAFSIIPLFTQMCSFVGETEIYFTRNVKYKVLLIEGICTGLQGSLDTLAFSADTSVWTTFSIIRHKLIERFVDRYEQDIADEGTNEEQATVGPMEFMRGEVSLREVETRMQRLAGWFMHGLVKLLFVKTLAGAQLLEQDDHVVGVEYM